MVHPQHVSERELVVYELLEQPQPNQMTIQGGAEEERHYAFTAIPRLRAGVAEFERADCCDWVLRGVVGALLLLGFFFLFTLTTAYMNNENLEVSFSRDKMA